METTYYELDDLMVMVIKINGVYQYYLRDTTEPYEPFVFAFGIMDKFTEEELWEREDYLWDCLNNSYDE